VKGEGIKGKTGKKKKEVKRKKKKKEEKGMTASAPAEKGEPSRLLVRFKGKSLSK